MEIRLITRGPDEGKLGVRYTAKGPKGETINLIETAPNTPAGRKKLEEFIKNRPGSGKVKDLKKRNRIKQLAKTGKYTRTALKEKLGKEFGGKTISDAAVSEVLKEEKIKLPQGKKEAGKKQSAAKSIYLKDYDYDELEKDLKAGKDRNKIADELLEKNKTYYKTLKLPNETIKLKIVQAIADRLEKGSNKNLRIIDESNKKKILQLKRTALRDVREFIKKNKEAYKKVYASNKIGAVDNFKEKVLDYISQKYPTLIKRAEGGRNILSGQRYFIGYDLLGRKINRMGEYGRDIELNKDIRKALGIKERPKAGEGDLKNRLTRTYNANLNKLLKEAQARGVVPKIDPQTGNPINSEASYYRYIKRTQIDPIRNLFGKKFNFGQEHVGGISRAALINDVESLTKITAMDPVQNKFVQGPQYDTRISSLVRLAKQSSGDKAKGYLEQANKLIEESEKKFGLDRTKLKIVKDRIVPIQPKSSLDDSMLKKAQRAIKSFIATGRDKLPEFKEIDPFLQDTIKTVKRVGDFNPASNRLLSKALRRTGVAGLVAMLGVGMLGGEVEAAEVKQPEVGTPIKYDSNVGAIVNENTDQPASQNQILSFVKDNPLPVVAGTSYAFAAQEVPGAYKAARELGRGKVRSALGITGALKPLLTTIGTPAMTGLLEVPMAAKRLEEGETATEILTDPLGPALGLTFMEPFSRGAGVIRDAPKRTIAQGLRNYFNLSDVGKARPGATSAFLRLGMSPRMIAGASRFLGLPGLLLGTGLSAYDAYKNYQNQEGMIYNLFNKDE